MVEWVLSSDVANLNIVIDVQGSFSLLKDLPITPAPQATQTTIARGVKYIILIICESQYPTILSLTACQVVHPSPPV